MTRSRESPYLWVTWASRLLAGEAHCEWSRLVQGSRLPLQERQVVDRVVDEIVSLVGAGMLGDDLRSAADDHLIHVAPQQHFPVSISHRHRVVVGPVSD